MVGPHGPGRMPHGGGYGPAVPFDWSTLPYLIVLGAVALVFLALFGFMLWDCARSPRPDDSEEK